MLYCIHIAMQNSLQQHQKKKAQRDNRDRKLGSEHPTEMAMKKQAYKQENVQLIDSTYEGNIPQLCMTKMLVEQLQREQKYHIPNLREWNNEGNVMQKIKGEQEIIKYFKIRD